MRSSTWLGGLMGVVAAGAIAGTAAAQGGSICGTKWQMPPAGSWAEWQGKDGTTTKIAIIDDEQRNGKAYHRLEMTSSKAGGAMQMVVPGWPPEMQNVDEMVMQRQGQPPMKMSGQTLASMKSMIPTQQGGVTDFAKRCGEMTVVGPETVTVPAGTYKTTHLHDDVNASDVWFTTEVPFGMVKFSGKEVVMQLTGTGKDAKTVITGTPTEMSMPPMMDGKPKN